MVLVTMAMQLGRRLSFMNSVSKIEYGKMFLIGTRPEILPIHERTDVYFYWLLKGKVMNLPFKCLIQSSK